MAKSFIAELIMRVTSKGLKQTQVDSNRLADSIDKVADAHANADKKSRGHFNTLEKGVIGTANGTKSFSKMAETMGNGGTSLVGIYATLAANIFAVTAAFNALRGAAQVQQVMAGLEAQGARLGLTLTVTADRVRNLAQGMLTTEQALRSTAQFMAGGFKTDQLERMTVLARDISISLGRNMTDSMDRLTRGTLKLEPELLDELGIMTKLGDATSVYAAQLGKPVTALTQLERRQGFMNAVLAEGELKFGGLADAAGNTSGYDKLGATFQDLMKDFLNGINFFALPFAEFISNSKGALVGLSVLFISTIKGQLLPMFNNLGASAEAAANTIRSRAIKTIGDMGDALDDNQHDVKIWADEVEKGTARSKDFSRTLKIVDGDIANLNKRLNNPRLGDKKRGAYELELENLQYIRKEMETYDQATKRASANAFGSSAINEMAGGSFKQALDDRKRAIELFNASLTDSSTRMERLRVAGNKLTLTMRMVGAGFLNMLPWIGLAVTAWGLLSTLWAKKTTPEQEKLKKVTEEFGTILDKVGDKITAYNKMNNSIAGASLRVAEQSRLQANAVTELVTAYEELTKAREAANKADAAESAKSELAQKRKEMGFVAYDKRANSPEYREYAKLSSTIQRAEKLDVNARSAVVADFSKLGLKETDKELVQLLDSIQRIDQDGYAKLIKTYKQLGLTTTDHAGQVRMAEMAYKELSNRLVQANQSIEGVQSAFKAADDAVGKFLVSSVISTPFDDMTKGMNESSVAVRKMQIDLEKGIVSAEQFAQAMSGIGDKFATLLSGESSNMLREFKTLDATIQAMRNTPGADQSKLVDLERQRADLGARLSQTVSQSVIDNAKLMTILQNQSRVLQGQLKLEEARRKTISGIYALNGKGMLEQFEHEEKMRGMQVRSLQLEMKLYQAIIDKANARIQELELSKAIFFQNELDRRSEQRMMKIRAEALAIQSVPMYDKKAFNERIKAIIMEGNILEETRKATELNSREVDLQIEQTRNSISSAQASLTNLQNQAAAILAENLSQAQKLARANQKDYEVSQKYVEMLKEQATILADIGNTHQQIREITEGTSGNLSSQINAIQAATREAKGRLRVEFLNTTQQLVRDRAVAEADRDRAKAEGQRAEGAKVAIDNINNEIDGRKQLVELTVKQMEASEQLQILQLLVFNTRKEGLEWQRQSLEYTQKELEVNSELAKTRLENAQARERFAILRRGEAVDQNTTRAQEIERQIQAYQIAIRELEIRENVIDLEYALLEAQRVQLREELDSRRMWLLATTNLTEDSTQIRQLTSAIENLDRSGSVERIRDNAKAAIRESIEGMRLGLKEASLGTNEFIQNFSKMGSAISGILRVDQARRNAAEAAQRGPGPSANRVTAEFNDNKIPVKLDAIEKRLTQPLPVMVSIEQNVAAIATDVRSMVSGAAAGTGGNSNAAVLARAAQELGTNAKDLATVISYETAGTFDPSKRGGAGNRHIGLIQFGIEEQRKYGAAIGQTFEQQMIAVVKYLKDRGFKPGMGLLDLYSTINAGSPGLYNRSDNGGKDNIRTHVARMQRQHGANADKFLGGQYSSPVAPVAAAATPEPPKPVALTKAQEATVAQGQGELETWIDGATGLKHVGIALDQVSQPLRIVTSDFGDLLDYLPQMEAPVNRVTQTFQVLSAVLADSAAQFRELGPGGEVAAAIAEGMSSIISVTVSATENIQAAFDVINSQTASSGEKFNAYLDVVQNGLSVLSSAVSMIQSVVAASANAQVASIEQQIDAEKRRDGKSAESQAKMEALERRKDQIRKKEFNTNKKLMMANAIINTAAGITSALRLPPPMNFIMAGIIGAMGAAQLAIIAGTSYQSTSAPSSGSMTPPSPVSVGKRGDNVDLARNNPNAGGEVGYLRGAKGYGRNASDYNVIGSAYGGGLPRGYGNTAFAVGEHGPEVMTPDTPITVRPIDNSVNSAPAQPVQFNIQALDASGVEQILLDQRGNIIGMLREAANANGQTFLEDVNVNVYTKPRTSRL